MTPVIMFGVGLVLGLLLKGIHIHHYQTPQETKPTEYNESLTEFLAPEVRNYYESTLGKNKF